MKSFQKIRLRNQRKKNETETPAPLRPPCTGIPIPHPAKEPSQQTLHKYKTIIFVHGCFWHRHPDCKYAYTPKSNVEFWTNKLEGNVTRDSLTEKTLEEMDWHVLTVWECEVKTLLENASLLREMITQ